MCSLLSRRLPPELSSARHHAVSFETGPPESIIFDILIVRVSSPLIISYKIGKAKVLFHYFTFLTKLILVQLFIKSHFSTSALRIKLIKLSIFVLLKAPICIHLVIRGHTLIHAYIHIHTYTQSGSQMQLLTRIKPARKTQM